MNSKDVTFDRDRLVRLRRAYEKAKMSNKEVFTFEGKDYLIDYAKYLIEYLAHVIEGK
jgi:hypothetical protein